MTTTVKLNKKLIEVALPLDDINIASAREKSIRHGHPSTLHLWWARRPLAAARALQAMPDTSLQPENQPEAELRAFAQPKMNPKPNSRRRNRDSLFIAACSHRVIALEFSENPRCRRAACRLGQVRDPVRRRRPPAVARVPRITP